MFLPFNLNFKVLLFQETLFLNLEEIDLYKKQYFLHKVQEKFSNCLWHACIARVVRHLLFHSPSLRNICVMSVKIFPQALRILNCIKY